MAAEKNMFPNLDWPAGRLYHALGLEIPLYTPIFAISRVAGWSAHVIEQLENNRLIRPRSLYTGPATRAGQADRRAGVTRLTTEARRHREDKKTVPKPMRGARPWISEPPPCLLCASVPLWLICLDGPPRVPPFAHSRRTIRPGRGGRVAADRGDPPRLPSATPQAIPRRPGEGRLGDGPAATEGGRQVLARRPNVLHPRGTRTVVGRDHLDLSGPTVRATSDGSPTSAAESAAT